MVKLLKSFALCPVATSVKEPETEGVKQKPIKTEEKPAPKPALRKSLCWHMGLWTYWTTSSILNRLLLMVHHVLAKFKAAQHIFALWRDWTTAFHHPLCFSSLQYGWILQWHVIRYSSILVFCQQFSQCSNQFFILQCPLDAKRWCESLGFTNLCHLCCFPLGGLLVVDKSRRASSIIHGKWVSSFNCNKLGCNGLLDMAASYSTAIWKPRSFLVAHFLVANKVSCIPSFQLL